MEDIENQKEVTLEELIAEAKEIRKLITRKTLPRGHYSFRPQFQLSESGRYHNWKNLTLRYLLANFPSDRCIEDFEKGAESFRAYINPSIFENLIALLEACKKIPKLPITETEGKREGEMQIIINQTQSQTQSQEQKQDINLFLEAIKDEITGKQLKELQAIVSEEKDPRSAYSKVKERIKKWGGDVLSNIIANIVTNPNIWSQMS